MRRLLFLLPFIVSMGEPVKDSKTRIEVEDKKGIIHSLSGLTCDGRGHLKVREGNLEYSIGPQVLNRIEVLSAEGSELRIRAYLKDGSSKDYFVPANTYCKARSQVGQAGFYLKDVSNISIKEEK
ncbi:MAG: hypothetical protein ACK4OF_02945 [Aquificaceae bacterium]